MKQKSRGLSDEFLNNLKVGYLKAIVDLVKRDHTLLFQIRDESINIYYRGGSLIRLDKVNDIYYAFTADKFSVGISENFLPKNIKSQDDINKWIENIYKIKQRMDEFYSKHSKGEREFQQLVARENNNSMISNDTDYFITDIEYTNSESKESRFDLIGIKWLSQSQSRMKADNCRLALIEMKYGDGALTGKAGIEKHISDIDKFCDKSSDKLKKLKDETIQCFRQLRELELVRFGKNSNKNQIGIFTNEKPEFILLLANHKPSKTKLKNELNKMSELKYAELKIATSNFMGYGLYANNILSIEEFNKQYKL